MRFVYLFITKKKEYLYSPMKNEDQDWNLVEKPFIGFEPMTYALPWRYSTTELKGPAYFLQFKKRRLIAMSLYIDRYIYTICTYIYLCVNRGSSKNREFDLTRKF